MLRALCPLAALALVAPAAASAQLERASAASAPAAPPLQHQQAAGPSLEGTLIVRSGDGVVIVNGRGTLLGQLSGRGRVLVEDPDPSDGVPVVSGYDRMQRQSRTTVLYIGSDLRFRLLTGAFKLKLVANGITLSFVGRGTAALVPAGTGDDGEYSIDGGDTYRPIGGGGTINVLVGVTPAVMPPSVTTGIALERP